MTFQSLELRSIEGVEFRVYGLRFRVQCSQLRSRIQKLGCDSSDSEIEVTSPWDSSEKGKTEKILRTFTQTQSWNLARTVLNCVFAPPKEL